MPVPGRAGLPSYCCLDLPRLWAILRPNVLLRNPTTILSLLASSLFSVAGIYAKASTLDTIGVTLLRQVTTNLDGTGVRVCQAEAQLPPPPANAWEVNPESPVISLPIAKFTYFNSGTSANTFTNSLGVESSHANGVGGFFYGLPGGVATNVAHIDNYEADYFLGTIIPNQTSINDKIVNQSFADDLNNQTMDNTNYDDYAALYGTLFISSAGNGGNVLPPASCYNGMGVGAYGVGSSIGPTTDNGRSKPDITAPADATSDSAPLVAGAAAILRGAGLRGDGGSDTNSAADLRMLKALLLNGAIKPTDWTNGNSVPLDQRYGAGILNVFESYEQMTGGKHGYNASSAVPVGGAHPPISSANNISSCFGWDFNTNTSSSTNDEIEHYYFNLTNGGPIGTFTGTATLVWNKQQNRNAVNELDLYLYNASTSNLIAFSSNSMDNVKHVFIPQLAPGRYDLQVLKKGGSGTNFVTPSVTYALAFEFFQTALAGTRSGNNLVLTWPVYPAGFRLEATSNLAPTAWSAVNATPIVTNSQNVVTLSIAAGNQFFRLVRP